MATLKSIRTRIVSVKNTQKITKAMKMVSAAKLRRAQSALMQSRPHARILQETVERLVNLGEAWNHPLVQSKDEPKTAEVLVMTSERGLCGGFNGNLLRKTESFIRHDLKRMEKVAISTIGRKGRDYYRAKNRELRESWTGLVDNFNFPEAQKMAWEYTERFRNGDFDVLYLSYNSFKSAIAQEPTILQVLPLQINKGEFVSAPLPIWEGDSGVMLDQLLARLVATQFLLAMRESYASELGARMNAMENATTNSSELIHSLTLQYNRARQAAITTELMDIVNGAEALK